LKASGRWVRVACPDDVRVGEALRASRVCWPRIALRFALFSSRGVAWGVGPPFRLDPPSVDAVSSGSPASLRTGCSVSEEVSSVVVGGERFGEGRVDGCWVEASWSSRFGASCCLLAFASCSSSPLACRMSRTVLRSGYHTSLRRSLIIYSPWGRFGAESRSAWARRARPRRVGVAFPVRVCGTLTTAPMGPVVVNLEVCYTEHSRVGGLAMQGPPSVRLIGADMVVGVRVGAPDLIDQGLRI
jgi:hypothetical protein